MKMPPNPRVGLWGNYGHHKPFKPLGIWIGKQIPDYIIGKKLQQVFDEGILRYRVSSLFDDSKPKREKVEIILVLESREPEILNAMWLYQDWQKEDTDGRSETERTSPETDEAGSGNIVPW